MVGDIMQPTHLLFVLVVALLVLGPKRLPEVGRQLGNGLRDFRAAISGEHEERHPVVEESFSLSDHEPAQAPTGTPTGDAVAHEHAASPPAPSAAEAGPGSGAEPPHASATQRTTSGAGSRGAGPDGGADQKLAHESSTSGATRSDPVN